MSVRTVGVVSFWRPAKGSVRASTYFRVVGIAAGIGAALGPVAAHADDGALATRELLFQRSKGASLTPVVSRHAVGATLSLGWEPHRRLQGGPP